MIDNEHKLIPIAGENKAKTVDTPASILNLIHNDLDMVEHLVVVTIRRDGQVQMQNSTMPNTYLSVAAVALLTHTQQKLGVKPL